MLQVKREENLLEDVFGFCLIPDDAVRNREYLAAVAMKQQRETVRTPLNYVAQQDIVSERVNMLVRQHFVARIIGAPSASKQ